MPKENEKTFEQALARLEEIAESLEGGDLALDDTMALFEEANNLAQFCNAKLAQAEEKLVLLSKKQGDLQQTVEPD